MAIESQATPEQQAEAAAAGWKDPTNYKGPEDRFIDADQFLKNRDALKPIWKTEKAALEAKVAQLTADRDTIAATLEEVKSSVEEIEARYTVETQKRVENARKDLKAQIREAAEADDIKLVVKLTDALDDLDESVAAAKAEEIKAKRQPPEKKDPPIHPEAVEWMAENKWFETDAKKRTLFLSYSQILRAEGETAVNRAFFDKVVARMEGEQGGKRTERFSEGKNGTGEGGGGKRSGKTFDDLPKDAKDACDADGKKFIGKGAYKDQKAWRDFYTKTYFEGETA